MRNISLLLLLMGLFSFSALTAQEDFRSERPKAGPASRIDLGNFKKFKLKNGLQVIMVENHKLPRISFQLFVDVPPFKEGDAAGTASMAGQLMNKGTKKRTKAEIDEAVDFIGATLTTSSSGVFASGLSRHKDALLDLMSEVIFEPSFPQEEFDKLKKQTLSALAQSKEDPNSIASSVAQVVRYGKDHPYGEVETEATVENITLEGCKKFYDTYFAPNLSYLIVVGDITEKETRAVTDKYFKNWKQGVIAAETFATPKRSGDVSVDFVNKTGAVQSVVNVTYPIDLKPGSKDAIPANLLNTILGSGFSGRLFQNLREDKGYTYGAYSTMSSDKEVGYFNASASVRNEVTDSSVVQFLYEMERLGTEKIPEDEIQLSKNKIFGSLARSMERPQTIARFALNTARYNLPDDYYSTYFEKLEKVDADVLMAVAKKYVTPDNAHVLVVGNKGEVADKLVRFDSDGKINFLDAQGDPVKDEDSSIPEGITAQTVIADYLTAIGGADKLKAVKDITRVAGATVQGMALKMEMKQKESTKMSMVMSMGGMPMSTQVYDGRSAKVVAQGQNQPVDDKALAAMKEQAVLFPELMYGEMGYELKLGGVEDVNGAKAYVINVTSPSGEKQTQYFDMSSSLKVRVMTSQEAPTGTVTITTDLSDYKEVDGIKFPFKTTVSGMMPIPLTFETESIMVNKGIEDSVFSVE
ncbi:MAG: insulinase family protein [Bacteroidota bacterium]